MERVMEKISAILRTIQNIPDNFKSFDEISQKWESYSGKF